MEKILHRVYADLPSLVAWRQFAQKTHRYPRQRKNALLAGNYLQHTRGRGMDFDEVRIYQPGDDIRTIDWRVTARTQKTHTKVYREERERPVIILCDQSPSLFFGSHTQFKSVLAANIAAYLAWTSLIKGDRVGGLVFDDETHQIIKPRRHQNSVLAFLNTLARYNQRLTSNDNHQESTYFNDSINQVRHVVKPGSLLFVISDFAHYDSNSQQALYQIAQHCQIIGIKVYDPLEKKLPRTGRYTVGNANERLTIYPEDSKLAEAFENQFITQGQLVKNDLLKMGIPSLEIGTDEPFIDLLNHQHILQQHR